MGLKMETIHTLKEYIPKLKMGIQTVIEGHREDRGEKNSSLMIEIIDGLRWVIEAMHLTSDVQVQEISQDKLKENLQAMLDALENEDSGLLIDLFEYEVLDILREYELIIENTIDAN